LIARFFSTANGLEALSASHRKPLFLPATPALP
jgi:hypothetical protein